jgi:hypothetical protein
MRIIGMAKSLNEEAEGDVELMAKLFDLQRVKSAEKVTRDMYVSRQGACAFVLTDFEGEMALVDVVRASDDPMFGILKGNSIKKLIEVKKRKVVLMEDSLAGSALPPRP